MLFMISCLASCKEEPIREIDSEAIFDKQTFEDDLSIHFFHLIPQETFEKTGESIFIQTPKGKNILIDAGIPEVGSLINDYLDELKVDRIDLAMPSHPHKDHIGGYITLFDEKEVEKIIEINLPHEESEVYQNYREKISDNNLEVEYAEEGDVIKVEENLYMEILHPMEGLSPNTYDFDSLTAGIINDVSMVIKMTYGENTFLFTGDIYEGVEKTLIEKFGDKLDVDVVVAPHHGLGTSSSEEFIEATNPDITVFPTNVVFDLNIIDRYEDQDSEVYVSKFHGNILLISDGNKIDIYQEFESEDIEENDEVEEISDE